MPLENPTAYERFKSAASEILGHKLPGPIGAQWNDLTQEQRHSWLILADVSANTLGKQTRASWHDLPQKTRDQLTRMIKTAARRAAYIMQSE